MNSEFNQVLENFSKVNVLVVGDVMLDRYWWGSVNRISPEAPVPIVNLEKENVLVGGAGNVAANIRGLGANPYLIGIIGEDREGDLLCQTLKDSNISPDYLIKSPTRPTTVKTRIVAHQQQIARIDQEVVKSIPEFEENAVWGRIESIIDKIDIVIISDYAKGVLTENLILRLIRAGINKNKEILVDPKGKEYKKYIGATLLTPNKKEAFEASGAEDVFFAGVKLLEELDLQSLLITQGEDGMTLFRRDQEPFQLPALARHVYDVTGAGDTVISTLAVSLGAKIDLPTAAKIANIAAGFVVEEIGTSIITIEKLKHSLV
ncbi:MAG TPA: D-glycero-beta-D-manno-heptose-7-phosphate kinase [Pyrinomonadaceae bacterium]|nr:D-glycero-beta-D-manno-heptose-7-phosphate kinase [Pyrinomonadaceae bacterium]